ncbi:MAG: hypothetical protein JWS10_3446 [Cypionkella sp.]|nr:hypothetical protein [Cypionkella sp.]
MASVLKDLKEYADLNDLYELQEPLARILFSAHRIFEAAETQTVQEAESLEIENLRAKVQTEQRGQSRENAILAFDQRTFRPCRYNNGTKI